MEDKSKSELKREAQTLQKMAIELCKLSEQQIIKLDLPENLQIAVFDYKKMTSNGAQRRQAQYIGKIMRNMDPLQLKNLQA